MWEKVKDDTTTKSTLYLINTKDQLTNMRLAESSDCFGTRQDFGVKV